MNEIQVFKNESFGLVRTIVQNGEPWFVGNDVASILGYEKPRNAIAVHVDKDDTLKQGVMDSLGRIQDTVFINESGLYSLILSSKLPNAKQFKRWVTSEVLPSIRQHGIYATDNVIDQVLNNPDFGIQLLTQLKDEREARKVAEKKVAILSHVNKLYTATEIAKECGLRSAQELNQKLLEKKIMFKQNGTWVPYSDYATLGYFEIKQEVLDNGHVVYYTKITQMGREFIVSLFNGKE